MVLADTLTLASRAKPDFMMDFAPLPAAWPPLWARAIPASSATARNC